MRFAACLTLIFILAIQSLPFMTPNALAAPETSFPQDPPSAEPSPTPDKELEDAKRNTALAEERQKKAEAEQAEVEARLARLKAGLGDQSKVTVPTGGITTDSEGFVEVKMLSLEAARTIASQLTSILCSNNSVGRNPMNTLVIYNEDELAAVAVYRTTLKQLRPFKPAFDAKQAEFEELYEQTDPETQSANRLALFRRSTGNRSLMNPNSLIGATAVPGLAAGVITSVAQLMNLFRTDTSFTNKNVAIPEDMVVSYIVNNFRSSCSRRPAIYYPHLYPTHLFNEDDSELLTGLSEIDAAKKTASSNVKKIEGRIKLINEIAGAIDQKAAMEQARGFKIQTRALLMKNDPRCSRAECRRVAAEIAELTPKIDSLANDIRDATGNGVDGFKRKFKGWVRDLKQLQSQIQFLIDAADNISTKLDTVDAASKKSAIGHLLQAEQLANVLKDESAFMLRVAVSANGTTKIKKNMFVDAKVRHSAGANLVYQLFDNEGRVVLGDSMQYYFDYQSAKAVRDRVAEGQRGFNTPQRNTNGVPAAMVSNRP